MSVAGNGHFVLERACAYDNGTTCLISDDFLDSARHGAGVIWVQQPHAL